MIRFILSVAIIFQSTLIYATPSTLNFTRYKVQFWNCNKPNRHPLLMSNRIVTKGTKIILASCSSDFDINCESGSFANIFTIDSMSQINGRIIAKVRTYAFDYILDFGLSRSSSTPEVSVHITSIGYDVTCSSLLMPLR